MKQNEFLVAPSMLSSDFAHLATELKRMKEAGADWIHWDVMDGHFVPNLTFGAPVLKKLRPVSDAFFDVHLMIENPEKYLKDFIEAGSDSLTLHIESTSPDQIEASLKKLKEHKIGRGLSLRPKTPVESLKPFLKDLDLVLVMTVEPGFGGQSFMKDQIEKVEELKKIREQNSYKYKIEVDGGITKDTAAMVQAADVLVAGSYVFKSKDCKKAIEELRYAKG